MPFLPFYLPAVNRFGLDRRSNIILMISYFISWFCFSFRRFYCSCSLYYCSCQNDRVLNNILANSITDVINVKFFILLSCICFLFFLFLLISLFPTIMFLNKFFSLNLLDNHSLSLVFNLVIFLLFIFQGFFLRSISLFLTLIQSLVFLEVFFFFLLRPLLTFLFLSNMTFDLSSIFIFPFVSNHSLLSFNAIFLLFLNNPLFLCYLI